jgi:hypothetical protein
MTCRARRTNEQLHCADCGLSWDVLDDIKPPCNPKPKPRALASPRRKDHTFWGRNWTPGYPRRLHARS